MIATTIPEIDVDELMQRVRAEAAKIAGGNAAVGMPKSGAQGTRREPKRLPPPPAPAALRPVNLKRERLDDLLRHAREDTSPPRWVPKALRGLFRRQGGYNRHLLEAVTSLVKTNSELANRVRDISAAAEAQGSWLLDFADRYASDTMRNSAAAAGGGNGAASDERVTALTEQLERLGVHVVNLQAELNAFRNSSLDADQFRGLERQVEQVGLQINHLQLEIGKNTGETRFAQRMLEQMTGKRSSLEQQVMRLEDRQAEDAKLLKAIVAEHAALLQHFALDAPPAPVR